MSMEKEFQGLINSAKAFELINKSDDSKKHIKDLEGKYGNLEKKRLQFKDDVNKLTEEVLGKKS